MKMAKRIITACLTATMAFQMLAPSTAALAAEADTVAGLASPSVSESASVESGNQTDTAVNSGSSTSPESGASSSGSASGSNAANASDDSASASGEDSASGSTSGSSAGSNKESAADFDATQDTTTDEPAQQEEAATVAAGTAINTLEELKTTLGSHGSVEDENGNTVIKFVDDAGLAIISNANPEIYKNATISRGGSTGTPINLVGEKSGWTFQGLGSESCPFEGVFDRSRSSIEIGRTFYNGIKLTASNSDMAFTWVGTESMPIIAGSIEGEGQVLDAAITIADTGSNDQTSDGITGSVLGTVKGSLSLKVAYSLTGSRKGVKVKQKDDNAGLLVNTVAANASLVVENVSGLEKVEGIPSISAETDGYCAGGLIGLAGSGSAITINSSIDVSGFTVMAKKSAGGFIGEASSLALGIKDGVTVKPATEVGDADTANAGGAFGSVSFAGVFTVKSGMFDFGDGTIELGASSCAGGLFGLLDMSNGDVTVQGGVYKSKLSAGGDNGNNRGNYGGLAGKAYSKNATPISSLNVVRNGDDPASIEIERGAELHYAGGVVGYLGGGASAAAVLSGVKVKCNGEARPYTQNGKYGGAVGVVDSKSILDIRDFKLESEKKIGDTTWSGGAAGIAGSVWEGVVKFSGVTDLSDAEFADTDYSAQLVYENYNALIFAAGSGSDSSVSVDEAAGWQYKRTKTPVTVDDIHDYGEVIRLGGSLRSDFITLGKDDHVIVLPSDSLSASGTTYTINGVEDFAKLAITWQTRGFYSMVNEISGGKSQSDMSALTRATINVTGAVNLSGTGLTGFTKDRVPTSSGENESFYTFRGVLTGSGSVSLAVGEPYGMRDGNVLGEDDTSDGNGKVYRHGRLGLFLGAGGASANGVAVGGFMKFGNKNSVDAGAFAAKTSGDVTVGNATFNAAITYDSSKTKNNDGTESDGSDTNVGGIIGSISNGANVTFQNSAKSSGSITSRIADGGSSRVGGAIGYVPGDSESVITVYSLTLGGNINIPVHGKDVLAGGFIGFIQQGRKEVDGKSEAILKNVNITGLKFDSFSMETSNSSAGGLLGYSWGNTKVVFGSDGSNESKYALSTNDSSVAANSASGFGGLVYAASGHWVVNDYGIDLSGATLSASDADKFGMLVCRGGSAVNENIGVEKMEGLYLEDKANWATAYKVNSDAEALNVKEDASFDEWVADSCRPGNAVDDCSVNGVVSLRTDGDRVNMDGAPSGRNTYVNRTPYGQSHQENGLTRYYYNLDRAYDVVSSSADKTNVGGYLNSPEKLLLWSARQYAAESIRNYITDEAWELFNLNVAKNITGTIDLGGYSYYPVDTPGIPVNINSATLTFHYSDIKSEEAGNKLNASLSQHMNMHAGLIRTFEPASSATQTLTVRTLTLAGTIGSEVNGGSGALICRNAAGGSSTSSIVKIDIDGLTLQGLRVDGVDEATKFAPLLVCSMPNHANLSVKHLGLAADSYTGSAKAATSLFGDLGGEDADLVTASFSDSVCVPGLESGSIFTKASLLNSFGFGSDKAGSATYIFYRNDDATYGKEIDSKGGEYEGLQLWYYDQELHGFPNGLVEDGQTKANADNPSFGAYLPYVAKGKEGTSYHEMKVNQRVSSLEAGCGSYGDPYVISSAKELYAATQYINLGSNPTDGWRVTVAANQEQICSRREDGSPSNEETYVFSSTNGYWVKDGDTNKALDNNTMHRYLQSAYYSIEPKDDKGNSIDTLQLDAGTFGGFGSKGNPFRGVIVGNLSSNGEAKILIEGNDGSLKGLIPYSYGSVVRNLEVSYKGSAVSFDYAEKSEDTVVPEAFFGGVIGCIMGGDNIVDGVQVSAADSFSVKGGGEKSYLVPIGGYVGTIAGGGVIFRNASVSASWRADTKDTGGLYDNPYVGRVIDGYAFSEECTVDNGDSNYKVNKLENKGTACVTTEDVIGKYYEDSNNEAIKTTVHNAQGLLVLSAIINSGAGAGASYSGWVDDNFGSMRGSNAYSGRTSEPNTGSYRFGNDSLGKVRNATYENVGKPAAATSDFSVSQDDDRKAPGRQNLTPQGPLDSFKDSENESSINSPYLVKNYASSWETGYVCAAKATGMDLQFAKGEYDMSVYGTGFVGLSGRYYSNACASDNGNDRDRIIPLIACINGNDSNLILSGNVQQYSDDDFFMQAWGGLFGAVSFTSAHASASLESNGGCVVKDLQIGGSKESSVSLVCLNKDSKTDTTNLGVGAFAGATINHDGLGSGGKYSNVKLVKCSVESPSMAGGLFGNAGWASRRADLERDWMLDFSDTGTVSSPLRLYDCSYKELTVKGATRIGGFVGAVGGGSVADPNPSSVEIRVTRDDFDIASDSTIEATSDGCIAGGIVGLAWSAVKVNAPVDGNDSVLYKTAGVKSVSVAMDGYGVASDASLSGIGGIAGNAKAGCDIRMLSIDSNGDAKTHNGSAYIGALAPKSNTKRAGGIVGQIDTARSNSAYNFDSIKIHNICIGANDSSGGIVGSLRNGMSIACNGITIDGSQIDGQWSGGIVGAINQVQNSKEGNGTSVTVSNSVISDTYFPKPNTGGIAGDGRGTFRLSNVLFDRNLQNSDSQGVLLGIVDTDYAAYNGQFKGLYASGIDVVPVSGTGATTPSLMRTANEDITKYVNKRSYIAFADYDDVLDEVSGSTLYNDDRAADGSEIAVDSASPYVTTNPVSGVKVKASEDSAVKNLFGDGAAITTAATIKANADNTIAGKYTYANIGGIGADGLYQNTNSYDGTSSKSTYNEMNTDSSKRVSDDGNFPVLLIPGNDTETVKNYLNLVTNGGFSDAMRLNGGDSPYVTAEAEMFELKDGSFVKSADAPSLSVVGKGTNDMQFRASTDWDNERGRFTLLTVTFNDGADHEYKVQVPIVVKRMLEIDFTATYTYGTNYKSDDYKSFASHVLTSAGDAMTGYLTWTYNQAKGVPTEYGWNTHLESGGAMKPLNKEIRFSGDGTKGTLPENTQLILVDTAHNDKEYKYTVPAGGCSSVRLTEFEDSNGNKYEEQWLSEAMGVKAEQSNAGIWHELSGDEDKSLAGAKVGDKYYRKAVEADSPSSRYNLSVDSETTSSESFYLVVRVPEGNVNGYTDTQVTSDVNTHINYVLRGDGESEDLHQNTASTYSIASGYEQELTDNREGSTQMKADGTDHLRLDVTDKIEPGDNEYNDNDSLYYQLNSSLVSYENGLLAGASGYPEVTTGAVYFYVKVGNNYYAWNGTGWENKGTTETAAVPGKPWSADGGDMTLTLEDGSGNAVDLKEIRNTAGKNGNFSIGMKVDLTMSGPACNLAIAASQDGATAYTKPTYRSFLSPHAETLSTSSMTADCGGNASYYRKDIGSSTIALVATMKTQLGINVNDLSSADGTIALAATYDFTKVSGAEEKLGKATKVTYTLGLQKRNDDGSYSGVGDISKYLTVKSSDKLGTGTSDGDSIVFIDDGLKTRDAGSLKLMHRFIVKVNTDIQDSGQTYANYRLVLTAHLDGDGVADTPVNASGSVPGYTNSDFVTYTITKVNLKGIDH